MDLPLVFDNVDVADTTAGPWTAAELAARMSSTWIAFARHGIPDNPAIPAWPPYTTEQRATTILDALPSRRVKLDLMLASLAPDDQPDLGIGGAAGGLITGEDLQLLA